MLLVTSLILGSAVACHCRVSPTRVIMTRLGPCVDVNVTTIKISEMRISRKLYDIDVTGGLNITKDIPDGWIVKVRMDKCQDIRNLDTCDYFRSFEVVKAGCSPEDSSGQDYHNFLVFYTAPSLSCPIRAGVYNITSYPLFMENNFLGVSESKTSSSMFGYIYRIEGYSEEQKILCADAYLQLVYTRKHNWLGGGGGDKTTTQASAGDDE